MVTLKGVAMGDDMMISYQYNTDNLDPTPTKYPTIYPTNKVNKWTT